MVETPLRDLKITKKRYGLNIDGELIEQLKEYAVKKHGRIHGVVKYEAEQAIRNHIKQGA